jgi:hypothetical protein
MHIAPPQPVPTGYLAHCPAPLQVPVVPQVDAGMVMQTPTGSTPPAGTGRQLPCWPVTAHELQLVQLADAQQNPSVQLPVKHSGPAAQEAPFALRLVQTFDWQVKPDAQSPSPPQVVRQAVGPQA